MAAPKEERPVIVMFTLDFETGSLECQTGGITQIAIHATRLDTFERLGSYVRYVYPYNRKQIDGVNKKRKTLKSKYDVGETVSMDYKEDALAYSAITMEMLETMGEDINDVARGAIDFIRDNTPKTPRNMKPFLLGQNIEFDKGYFMQMLEYTGLVDEAKRLLRGHVDFYGHWQPDVLDTITLGQLALCHLPNIDSYKLEIMAERLGIELDDAHDADADVAATTNVAAVLTQRMRSEGGTIVGGELAISKAEKSRKHFKI